MTTVFLVWWKKIREIFQEHHYSYQKNSILSVTLPPPYQENFSNIIYVMVYYWNTTKISDKGVLLEKYFSKYLLIVSVITILLEMLTSRIFCQWFLLERDYSICLSMVYCWNKTMEVSVNGYCKNETVRFCVNVLFLERWFLVRTSRTTWTSRQWYVVGTGPFELFVNGLPLNFFQWYILGTLRILEISVNDILLEHKYMYSNIFYYR